jgi:hypothetical protein
MIFGDFDHGTPRVLTPDRKWLQRVAVPDSSQVLKLSALMDGGAPGQSDQPVRGVLYDAITKQLLGTTATVTVPANSPEAWFDLPFEEPVAVPPSMVVVGLQSGGTESSARLIGGPAPAYTDSFADGASATIASDAHDESMPVFGTALVPWTPPDSLDEELYARMGFDTSQSVYRAAVPIDSVDVACGWHGEAFDPERGAFAIVRTDGALADRVGERIRLTREVSGERVSVSAYVHREAEIIEEISLTRGLYARLGPLAADELLVTVETLD